MAKNKPVADSGGNGSRFSMAKLIAVVWIASQVLLQLGLEYVFKVTSQVDKVWGALALSLVIPLGIWILHAALSSEGYKTMRSTQKFERNRRKERLSEQRRVEREYKKKQRKNKD